MKKATKKASMQKKAFYSGRPTNPHHPGPERFSRVFFLFNSISSHEGYFDCIAS